jgi:hypothetical protein
MTDRLLRWQPLTIRDATTDLGVWTRGAAAAFLNKEKAVIETPRFKSAAPFPLRHLQRTQ